MRATENKRRILEALRGLYDDGDYLEYGPPPYCAADVVLMIGGNLANTSRTLRLMERQGLVVSEIRQRQQWCEVPKFGHYDRPARCYWNQATMDEDKASVAAWRAGAEERSRAALDKLPRMR